MKQSSLQLESSTLTRIHVDANRAFPRDRASERFVSFAEADLESTVQFSRSPKDNRLYFVKLGIRLPGTETGPTPYILDLEIIGSFSFGSKQAINEKFVAANGPAVLYGSIRELVMQITSRGPYPPLVLPTVNFVPPDTQVDDDGRPSAPEAIQKSSSTKSPRKSK